MNLVNSTTSFRADGTPYFEQVKFGEWVPPSNISQPGNVVINSQVIWFDGSLTPASTKRDSDGLQITYLQWQTSSVLFSVTIALTIITIVVIIIIWLIMYRWRNTLMMKASSPPFNLTMLFGITHVHYSLAYSFVLTLPSPLYLYRCWSILNNSIIIHHSTIIERCHL
jgi:hypothetical protein